MKRLLFKIIFTVLAIFSLGCSHTVKEKEAAIQKIYQAQNYTFSPGEVKKIIYPKALQDEDQNIYCDGNGVLTEEVGNNRVAFIAESYFSKRTEYFCSIRLNNNSSLIIAKISVAPLEYPSERLHVDKKRVFLKEKDRKRVQQEQKMLNEIYKNSAKRLFFQTGFSSPLNSKVTSYYGARRIFNGKKQTQHLGTDFRAAVGVPIPSANSGKVVFAGDLFYTGNTVIIDHGLGIFTVYGHLSKLKTVREEYVPQGTIIGLAGRTGRVTGPHLHWGVKVNGHYINGNSLIRESR